MDFFLEMKTEASGYPSWCKSDKDKESFIKQFFEREGITLDRNKIEKSPGFRSLAKLMLNSLWGKLGQRADRSKKIIISDREPLFKLLSDPSLSIDSMIELTDSSVMFTYKIKEDIIPTQPYVSVPIAA